MSPNMKLSLLALVGTAAAVPHYNAHSRFHSSGGFVGPTGGWTKQNSTQPAPTASSSSSVVPVNDQPTTTVDETSYSTQTIYSTVTLTRPKSSSDAVAAAADLSTGSSACGPATVYVTATEKVTITVSGDSPSSSAAAVASSSSSPVYVVVSPSPVASVSSVSIIKEEASTSAAVVASSESAYVPGTTTAAQTSAAATSAASSAVETSAAPSSVEASSTASASASASSSSASASASSTGGYTGGKRGLAYRWDGAADCKSFADKMSAGFAWNWESDSRGDIGGINFVPTLRTLANAGDWSTNVDTAVKAGSKVVFGFNEPDEASQANLGVSAACDAWKQYMNPIATKYPDVSIVSPAVTSSTDSGKGLDWLSQFKSQCPEAVFDAVGIHWYGYGTAGFEEFKTHVESAISQFGKVWVTEFNLVNRSEADSKDFLEKALAYLDSNANCEGYSFYAVGSFDSSFNMLGTGSSLTEVGKVYVA